MCFGGFRFGFGGLGGFGGWVASLVLALVGCVRQIRKTIFSTMPDWKSVIGNPAQAISVPIDPQLYNNELELFKKLVDEEKLDKLIARYRLHKSPILSRIATTLRCLNRKDYECRVRVQIQ